MQKTIKFFISLILVSIVSVSLYSQSYTTEQPSKAVHIVYDDSYSMIFENGEPVDRWARAKYAMEVFAVMLEEKDTMRVYYMSDFDTQYGGKTNAPAKISISGSKPAKDRVATVHDTVSKAYNTPFDTVVKAYEDLKNTDADVKWLVVLTDGEFNQLDGQERNPRTNPVPVNSLLTKYAKESDVKVILLAMGNVTDKFKINADENIFFEQAKDNKEILKKITEICNRIFNRNKDEKIFTNKAKYEIYFDIPMIELLVFAQGPDVKINGIKGNDTFIRYNEKVNVKYSEVAADNHRGETFKIPKELTGEIASFKDVKKGSYSLDITGAQEVEIYFKPAVDVVIKLIKNFKESKLDDIPEGTYEVRYGIVNEEGNFYESSLLGNVEYSAEVQNNGQTIPIKSGESIKLLQGDFKVNMLARFLDFNTAKTSIPGRIKPPLTFKEWVKRYPYIFWPPVLFLTGLILYWLLWGTKKKFSRVMKKHRSPIIKIEKDGSNEGTKNGEFKINKFTVFFPVIPERGTIRVVPEGSRPKLVFHVRASSSNTMTLLNSNNFTNEKLSRDGVKVRINSAQIKEGTSIEMSDRDVIQSIYPSRDGTSDTIYKCFLGQSRNRRR